MTAPPDGFGGDSLPIGLTRTISDLRSRWFGHYEMVAERRIPKAEVESCRKILGRSPGVTMADRRRVILSSMTEADISDENQSSVAAMVTDCLGSHEIGDEFYFGHYSVCCDPKFAFTDYLADQTDLNMETYLLPLLGTTNSKGISLFDILTRPLIHLVESDWLLEMLALATEKNRWRTWLNSNQVDSIKRFIEKQIESDSLSNEFSAHGLGVLVWDKLHNKFGQRAFSLMQDFRTKMLLGNVRNMQEELMIDESKEQYFLKLYSQGKFGIKHLRTIEREKTPSRSPSGLHSISPLSLVIRLLDNNVKDSADIFTRYDGRSVSKAECFAHRARQIEMAPIFEEFTELKSLTIGELWLALNSIAHIQFLHADDGVSNVYMDKRAVDLCSPKAQKLAIDLLLLRNSVLSTISLQSSERASNFRTLCKYVAGAIDQKDLNRLWQPTFLGCNGFAIEGLTERVLEIQKSVVSYYEENKQKIERYLQEPEAFFSKILN